MAVILKTKIIAGSFFILTSYLYTAFEPAPMNNLTALLRSIMT